MQKLVVVLLVALAAIVPLLPTLRAAFVYDDTTIVRDNGMLRGWAAVVRVWSEPYWPTSGVDMSGLYRPLHVALLALVWNVGDGSPSCFIFTRWCCTRSSSLRYGGCSAAPSVPRRRPSARSGSRRIPFTSRPWRAWRTARSCSW